MIRNLLGVFVFGPMMLMRSRNPPIAPTETDQKLWAVAGLAVIAYNGMKVLRHG